MRKFAWNVHKDRILSLVCSVLPTIYRWDFAIIITENTSRLSTPAFRCMTVYDAYAHSL